MARENARKFMIKMLQREMQEDIQNSVPSIEKMQEDIQSSVPSIEKVDLKGSWRPTWMTRAFGG